MVKLFVALGKGDGTFAMGAFYPAGPNAQGVVTGDFNGDGKLDVATVSSGLTSASQIDVLFGNGNGTFQSPVSSTGVVSLAGVAAGDFDGDGKLDLSISDSFSGQTELFRGNGDGTFQPPTTVASVSGPLGAADVNGDGELGLIVAAMPTSIYLGHGNGSFTFVGSYTGGGPSAFSNQSFPPIIADFNNDGRLDVVAGNTMLLGNGGGSFKGQPVVLVSNPTAGIAADFNGDGNADLAVISANGTNVSSVSIFLGYGKGMLLPVHTYPLPSQGFAVAAADLNGDKKLDLVIATDAAITVLPGNGDGSFGNPIVTPGTSGLQITVADFNNDGRLDVAVPAQSSLFVYLGNGDGTLAAPVSYFAGATAEASVAADFNHDGKIDAVVSGGAGIGILLGNGDGTFQPVTFVNAGFHGAIATADLNGDGNADLVVSGATVGFQVFLGKGDGTFTALTPDTRTQIANMYPADFNGDGKVDFAATGDFGDGFALFVVLGNGDGTFQNRTVVTDLGNGGVTPLFLTVGDFNRDNKPDFVSNDRTDTSVFVYLNTT